MSRRVDRDIAWAEWDASLAGGDGLRRRFEPGVDVLGSTAPEPALHEPLEDLVWRSASGRRGAVQVARKDPWVFVRAGNRPVIRIWLDEQQWSEFVLAAQAGVFDDV